MSRARFLIRPYASLTFGQKIRMAIFGTNLLVLLVCCSALIGIDLYTFRGKLTSDLIGQAEILASNSVAAAMFDDSNAGLDNLSSLRADPAVELGFVVTTYLDINWSMVSCRNF